MLQRPSLLRCRRSGCCEAEVISYIVFAIATNIWRRERFADITTGALLCEEGTRALKDLACESAIIEPMALSHIGIFVSNLERSLDYYRRVFGYRLYYDNHATAGQDRVVIGIVADVAVELVERAEATRPETGSPADIGGNDWCISFSVAGVDAAYIALRAHGLANMDPPVTLANGMRSAIFRDPDGTLLEIIDLKGPKSLAARARSVLGEV
jgi:catechol 2,3-dioxygenase-like lactoylglutathione lyase family enzyme